MNYKIEYTPLFEKEIHSIDKKHAKRILEYLKNNIDGSFNPRLYGKSLKGNLKEFWRYR